jgi:hypothetical protein
LAAGILKLLENGPRLASSPLHLLVRNQLIADLDVHLRLHQACMPLQTSIPRPLGVFDSLGQDGAGLAIAPNVKEALAELGK